MKTLHTVLTLAIFSVVSSAQESKPVQQKSYSPDKKWEFCSDKIVRAGATEPAIQLSNKCGGASGECEPPIWSPDSKRFALNAPDQGRYQPTSFYQLNGDEWKEIPLPDAISDVMAKVIYARMKKMGLLPKNTPLRLMSNPIRTIKWTDPDTALLYASDVEGVKDDPDRGFFEASFLFTLKFDQRGECKIVKSQRLSDKEREKYKKKSEP
jgi:hypothetical protein